MWQHDAAQTGCKYSENHSIASCQPMKQTNREDNNKKNATKRIKTNHAQVQWIKRKTTTAMG